MPIYAFSENCIIIDNHPGGSSDIDIDLTCNDKDRWQQINPPNWRFYG